MTRIWLLSDLHTETSTFDLPSTPEGAEVLVIAGDICEEPTLSLMTAGAWQQQCGLPTIFVPGNHDHYGSDLNAFAGDPDLLKDLAAAGLHVLHSGQSVVIAGCRFVGATLWTDFEIAGDALPAFGWFNATMPDAANIESDFGLLYGNVLLPVHKKHLAAIEAVLAKPFDGPTVVVTHHAPHSRSLAVPENIDAADASFASDLTGTIERYRPNAWLHGHVHNRCDYLVADTWIVCNPRGYVIPTTSGHHRENRAFEPGLVITVE